jgi:glucose-6-phosphate isomerase
VSFTETIDGWPGANSCSLRAPYRRLEHRSGTGNLYQRRGDYDRAVSDEEAFAVEAEIPESLRPALRSKLTEAAQARLLERIEPPADATVWGPAGTAEISNRLGWLTISARMEGQLEDLRAFAGQVRADGLRDVVLLGMGGSSLAPEVLRRCFGTVAEAARLHVLDSTDASTVAAVQGAIDPARTLFVVSSKSGGTIEPLSLFAHFFSLHPSGANFAAITDPGSGLQHLAQEHRFRRVFHGDPDIGGRYSALSAFGIVPAALMGADVQALLEGADAAWHTPVRGGELTAGPNGGAEALPAWLWLGAAMSALAQQGRDKLTFLIDPSLPGLGLWLEQLVAESTGKQHTGILPVAEEPPGTPGSYGEDRVFVWIGDADHDGGEDGAGHARAYAKAGHPVIRIPSGGPADLGRLFLLAELAVAVAGWGLQINPFDQPNVQQAKDATNRVLSSFEQTHALPQIADADEGALRVLLAAASPPAYVALMGYVQPSADFDAAVAELRAAIRDARKVTTTFGYGPRFLHSTGQFHKGGPPIGRFLQLLHDGPADVDIPGRGYTFTTLKNAQATGDLQTLRQLGLPAERVRLQGDDPAGALRALTTRIKELL